MVEPTLSIEVPLATVSLNTWQRLHWAKREKLNKLWVWEIRAAASSYLARHRTPKWGSVDIIIERTCLRPIKDTDNLMGGYKPVFDALVKVGIIEDDTREVIQSISTIQLICTKKSEVRTIIKVRPYGT